MSFKGRDMKFFDKKDTNTPPHNEVPVPVSTSAPAPVPVTPVPAPPPPPKPAVGQQLESTKPNMMTQKLSQTIIGSSMRIKGEVIADENVMIEGVVEGSIESTKEVRVAPEGRVRANIRATNVMISGKVKGDVSATNKVDLERGGQLEGNIHAPKLAIAESALFRGSIDMSSPGPSPSATRYEKERKIPSDSELVKR
jgi:cytoskeletal protein CcmA (bactofilin family)